MSRLFATVSMNNGSQSQTPAQGAWLFVMAGFSPVESSNLSAMMRYRTDPEKVPLNGM